jgi:hypothetical protein
MLRELNRGLSIMLEVSKLSDFEFERREGAEKCFFKTKKDKESVRPPFSYLLSHHGEISYLMWINLFMRDYSVLNSYYLGMECSKN